MFSDFGRKMVYGVIALTCFLAPSRAQGLVEGFENVASLQANPSWTFRNNSTNAQNLWRQGSAGPNSIGPAPEGSATSYALANFMDTASTATSGAIISNWLITPAVLYANGDAISFFTRTAPGSPFPDRLEVRFSANGTSDDVGTTPSSVGDFTNVLLTINPDLLPGNYPEDWTPFTLTLSGLTAPTTGRVAFRYFVSDAGANGINSNIVGLDSLHIQNNSPEPHSILLVLIGVAGFIAGTRTLSKVRLRP